MAVSGEIKLPSGKKVTFNIKGVDKSDVRDLIKKAQPNVKVTLNK